MRCAYVCLVALGCGHHDTVSGPEARVTRSVTEDVLPAPAPVPQPGPCATEVKSLGPGLTAEQVVLAATPAAGAAPCLDVVRTDAAHHRLRVLTQAREGRSQAAPAWRETFHLIGVINAGMFHQDGKPVGMIVEDGTAVSGENKQYSGFLAFDPRNPKDAAVVVTGRDCTGFDVGDLRTRYRSLIQAPRLLGCRGEALPWQDKKQYSAAAVGVDRAGRVVFLHARAAITMTELAGALASLDLAGALFLEGGPEASLVVRGADGELARMGSYETGFVENDTNQSFWWLPNVVGLEALP